MMLFLSPALSHWWNHMVPALTRDEFPQCVRLNMDKFWRRRWILPNVLTHCVTHSPTYTHMHTAHDTTHASMPTWHADGNGRACR